MNEINQLVEKLKEYRFECEGGPLENCVDYQRLVELAVQAQKERDYFENIVVDVAEDLASDEDGPDYEDLPGIVYDLAVAATERAHEVERLHNALREFADPDNWGINLETGDLTWLPEKIGHPKYYAQEVLGIIDEETEFPEEGR